MVTSHIQVGDNPRPIRKKQVKIVHYKTSDSCATACGRNKSEELTETLSIKRTVIHPEHEDMSLEGGVLSRGYLEGTLGR